MRPSGVGVLLLFVISMPMYTEPPLYAAVEVMVIGMVLVLGLDIEPTVIVTPAAAGLSLYKSVYCKIVSELGGVIVKDTNPAPEVTFP